jgi:archaellum biogenesis protein FlaJ (TadC family)
VRLFLDEEDSPGLSKKQKIIYGYGGAGAAVVVIGFLFAFLGFGSTGLSMIIMGVLMGIIPYGILIFLKSRYKNEIENQFPLFLKGLAESKRGGMTLIEAFDSAKNSDYGRLNEGIEEAHNQLTWGIPFTEVMDRFREEMSESTVINQSTSIILQSFKSGGDITQTIESVAEDASRLRTAVEEKNSKLKQQLLVMYVIFFLFIGITIGIYVILNQMVGFGSEGGGALENMGEVLGTGGNEVKYCTRGISLSTPLCTLADTLNFIPGGIDPASQQAASQNYDQMAYYKSLLFTTLIVQAVSTSAVAGKIIDGKAAAGIKHAIVMMLIGSVVFLLTVGQMGV